MLFPHNLAQCMLLSALSIGALAQDSIPNLIATLPLSVSTGIPFFDAGHAQCSTIVTCDGLGSATVSTVTMTVPGISPSGSVVTLTPTTVKSIGINTVTIIPSATEVGVVTVTKTLTRGETVTETVSTSPPAGAPWTHIIVPGGDMPSVKTSTTTLTSGHAGTETITIGPSHVIPGHDAVVTVIPPVTSDITITGCPGCCPAQATVTVTREPQAAPSINITKPDGGIERRPASKFPCSADDRNPCRGTQVQGWTAFYTLFGGSRICDGKTYPNPFKLALDYTDDTILTVSDSWYQAEHWTITLDGQKLGETYEDGFKNELLACSDGDDCIQKGFSHGSFVVPKGSHDLEIAWTNGPLTYGGGALWPNGYGVYRFDLPCKCGHDEL